MSQANIEKALRHLRAALVLLDQTKPKVRRREWFRATGHLSAEGIAHLNSLFSDGKSTYAAAKEMGISYRSAVLRRKKFYSRRAAVF